MTLINIQNSNKTLREFLHFSCESLDYELRYYTREFKMPCLTKRA